MGTKLLKGILFSLLGILVSSVLLIILSFVFPYHVGEWIDGIPFGFLYIFPKSLLGSLLGAIVVVLYGKQKDNIGKGLFLGSFIGGVIGILVSILLLALELYDLPPSFISLRQLILLV